MEKSDRDRILKGAEGCFFDAMLHGYAAGIKGTPVSDVPGYKEIVHRDNFFRVVDRWCVSSEGSSAGTTTIWFANNPIWFMSYGGSYPKRLIPFLKQALMENYSKNVFLGGRGPSRYKGSSETQGLVYFNEVDNSDISCFRYFVGEEKIVGLEVSGWHNYFGMTLI